MTKNRKRGGRERHLRAVEEVQAASAAARRLACLAQLLQRAVELRGRDPAGVAHEHLLDHRKQPLEAAARVRGHGDERRSLPEPREDVQPYVLDADLGDVPLREDDDRRALRLARDVGHREILLDHALARVDQDERDVRPLGCLERAQLGVVLDPLPLLPLAAQAGRVDEHERRVVVAPEHGVDRVARRARDVRHDHALTSHERVQERRLADVRPPEDRDLDRLVADRPLAVAGKPRDDLVEQVARAVAVQRRDRDRVAEPQPMEVERLEVPPRVVELVREHEHRAPGRAQDLGELLVARRHARGRVDDEEHEIGLLDGLRAPGRRSAGRTAPYRSGRRRPVSMRRNVVPDHSQRSSLRSRVTPGVSWTTAVRVDVRRLISVDLPTFGKPTIATVPAISTVVFDRDVVVDVAHGGGVASRGRPSSCTPASQSHSFVISRSISTDASL